MATQTSNLGLTKPAYSETADIADINNNMDKVDAAVNGVQNGIAILANGNVHSAITSGQYVYVRNHGTLAEGLYTATTNISTNATLSTSNLTPAPSNGALNTLRDDVTSLASNLSYSDNADDINVTIAANSVGVLVNRSISGAAPTGTTIKAITDVYCPGVAGYVCPAIGDNGTNLIIRGLNINTTAVTVTKVKYRIWYK